MPVFSDPQSIVSHNCLSMTDLFQWKSFENNDTLAESKRRKHRIHTELLHMHKMLVLDPDLMQYPETDHIVLYRFVRSAVMNTRHLSVSVFFVIQYYSTKKNQTHGSNLASSLSAEMSKWHYFSVILIINRIFSRTTEDTKRLKTTYLTKREGTSK